MISIIIPCYNQGKYLNDCLSSVLHQSISDWECIIVNDGSIDNTQEVAAKWVTSDFRYKYLYKDNGGLSSARNAGLLIAKGSYVQFLDADDLIAPRKLEIHLEFLKRNPNIDICYSLGRYFQDDDVEVLYSSLDKTDNEWQPRIISNNTALLHSLLSGNIMPCNCALVRSDAIKKIGFFNESLSTHEDYEYWVRMAIGGRSFCFVDDINAYAYVRMHKKSMSNDMNKMRVGFLEVRFLLLKSLIKSKNNLGINLHYQLWSVKTDMASLFYKGYMSSQKLGSYLNLIEKIKLRLSYWLPDFLRIDFLLFSRYTLRKYFLR